VIVPESGGKKGHPLWLSADFVLRVLKVSDSKNARLDRLIAQLPEHKIFKVAVNSRQIHYNLNTLNDFEVWKKENLHAWSSDCR
jgi:CTP:molybdopterin cytidylyltransferase MocA